MKLRILSTVLGLCMVSWHGTELLGADLIVGGTARFTFDAALSAAETPLNNVDAVFTGTQTRSEVTDLSHPGDPFSQVQGSQKTVVFSLNSLTPAVIAGRPNNAATNLDFDAGNPLASWDAGTDLGAFLIGGEQIGLQSMTRWTGDFTGYLIFGDFAIRNAPGRADGVRSGLVLVSNIDFANATYADLANMTTVAAGNHLTMTGDLVYSDGFALLTNDPTDAGVKFGTFEIQALTAVPEPSGLVLCGGLLLGLCLKRRRQAGASLNLRPHPPNARKLHG